MNLIRGALLGLLVLAALLPGPALADDITGGVLRGYGLVREYWGKGPKPW